MSSLSFRIDQIWIAINELERAAESISYIPGRNNWERSRDMKRVASEAMAQYNALSAALPRLRDLNAAAEREYDRYATRMPEMDGCSCHLSAPCSYCTRDIKDEAA